MSQADDLYCSACGRISPPGVQVCLCGKRFETLPYQEPAAEDLPEMAAGGRHYLASFGMFFSILGICLFLWWPAALACSAVGFGLSLFGLNSKRRGMAIAGLVCGIIGLALGICSALGAFDIVRGLPKLGLRPRVDSQLGTGR